MRVLIQIILVSVFAGTASIAVRAEIYQSNTPREFIAQSKEIKAAAKQVLDNVLSGTFNAEIPVQIIYAGSEHDISENSYRLIKETAKNCSNANLALLGFVEDDNGAVQRYVTFTYSDCHDLGKARSRTVGIALNEQLKAIGFLIEENVAYVASPPSAKAQ